MVVVVFKKGKTGKRRYMKVFNKEKTPDRIINLRSTKPLIPHNYIIEEMGMGESFIKRWSEKYKIKKYETI
jgi:hypothetical protein